MLTWIFILLLIWFGWSLASNSTTKKYVGGATKRACKATTSGFNSFCKGLKDNDNEKAA